MHKIKEKLMDDLYVYEEKIKKMGEGKVPVSDLQAIHLISDTIKNFDKIEMLGKSGYSEGAWEAMGSYNGGNSRAGYSENYDNHSYEGDASYRRKRDSMGRYSRDSGNEHMARKLEELMMSAKNEKQRESIQRCMRELEE